MRTRWIVPIGQLKQIDIDVLARGETIHFDLRADLNGHILSYQEWDELISVMTTASLVAQKLRQENGRIEVIHEVVDEDPRFGLDEVP